MAQFLPSLPPPKEPATPLVNDGTVSMSLFREQRRRRGKVEKGKDWLLSKEYASIDRVYDLTFNSEIKL